MSELGTLITLARIAGVSDYHKYYQYDSQAINTEIHRLCVKLDALEQKASKWYE